MFMGREAAMLSGEVGLHIATVEFLARTLPSVFARKVVSGDTKGKTG